MMKTDELIVRFVRYEWDGWKFAFNFNYNLLINLQFSHVKTDELTVRFFRYELLMIKVKCNSWWAHW